LKLKTWPNIISKTDTMMDKKNIYFMKHFVAAFLLVGINSHGFLIGLNNLLRFLRRRPTHEELKASGILQVKNV
jgi:hypothetical protein